MIILKKYTIENIGKYLFFSSSKKENYAQENVKINKNYHRRHFISYSTLKLCRDNMLIPKGKNTGV